MSKNKRNLVMNNPHNKTGVQVFFKVEEMKKLQSDDNFQTLMNWVEKSLRVSNLIISDKFFHPSFSKKQRDMIISIIYTCYDVVEDIQPFGKDGLVIKSKDILTMTELP